MRQIYVLVASEFCTMDEEFYEVNVCAYENLKDAEEMLYCIMNDLRTVIDVCNALDDDTAYNETFAYNLDTRFSNVSMDIRVWKGETKLKMYNAYERYSNKYKKLICEDRCATYEFEIEKIDLY